ncbi:AAA family ATPase [Staphylococcus shinii]|uniref:AAA family ATPase n=1 Tax=Staphylococcus shinii TaxID=2912228 RepID=UPI003EEA2A30
MEQFEFEDNLFDEDDTIEKAFQKLNIYFGYSLEYLNIDREPIVGRDEQIDKLNKYLLREDNQVAMLIGLAGAGKTATVESWGHLLAKQGVDLHLITLNIGALGSGEDLRRRISTLLPKLKEYEDFLKTFNDKCRVVLFIDEAHHIVSTFGNGSKEGGELLKPYLARAGNYVGVIAATTRDEYDTYIATDSALARRFKNLVINEVEEDLTVNILKNWLDTHTKTVYTENVDEEILRAIVDANRKYSRSDVAEPSASIDILESMHAYSRDENIPLDFNLLDRVFKDTNNVDLEVKLDPVKIKNTLKQEVRGQPLVLHTMNRIINRITFDDRKGDQPLATILSAGTSGVGKTQAAKAVAKGGYGSEKRLFKISMTDFNTAESAERFRKLLGTHLRHEPSCVVLFDEIEKAHETVQLSMLPILDEGIVSFFDTGQDGAEHAYTASLKNTIVFATSNKGSKIFGKINEYVNEINTDPDHNIDELTEQIKLRNRTLKPQIKRALIHDAFRPELLERFNRIIPFATLSDPVLIDIAEKQIFELLTYFYSKGIDIAINEKQFWGEDRYPYYATEIAMFVAVEMMINKKDAAGQGARNIKNIIEEEVEGELLDAMEEYTGVKKFSLTTDGNCVFEEGNSAKSEGHLVVAPITY